MNFMKLNNLNESNLDFNILNSSEKMKVVRRTISYFVPFFLIVCIVIVIILFNYNKFEMTNFKRIENKFIKTPTQRINEDIADITSDLLILANQNEINQIFDSNYNINNEFLNKFSNELLSMSKFKKKYDQIRLLDNNGMEIIRVNFNNGLPVIVKKENLQNKKKRYYFYDAFKLKKGEVFISPLDLNIEKGEIEKPLKPMIRIATPIFDKNNKKIGIVLLNYFGNKLINNFRKYVNSSNENNLLLLNSDGYWLCSSNVDEEWGFMSKERKEISFKNKYPKTWERIISSPNGQFETSEGLYTFETIFPLMEGQISATGSGEAFSPSSSQINSEEYFWKSISFVPKQFLNQSKNKRQLNGILIIIILSTVSLYSFFKISLISIHREISREKLKSSEKKYRLMIENSGDAIAIRQNDKFIFVNNVFAQMLGYSINELLKIDSGKIFTNITFDKINERIRHKGKNITLGSVYDGVLLKKDDVKIDVEINEKIIFFNDIESQFVSIRDITKQKEMMEILIKGAEQTKGLKEFIPICANCNLIRDDEKENKPWIKPGDYITERLPDIKFSHGICPDCMKELYPMFGQNDDDD